MMDLGSGVALGALCISGGAVAITAIRTFCGPSPTSNGKDGIDGVNGRNGQDATFPCAAHSGVIVGIANIEKNQERQDKWLDQISCDVKKLLHRDP
jgi:hypothetical protein